MESPQAHTILVVEDQPPQRAVLTETLQAAGYQVAEAWNGEEAIAAVTALRRCGKRLCLILLDMKLPYVTGTEVLRYLPTTGIDVPVIAISAHDDLLAAAITAGACATVPKPFDLDELLAVVARHCCR